MGTQLTPQQQQALNTQKDHPLRIINPRSHTPYILVPELDYKAGRKLLEDEHKRSGPSTRWHCAMHLVAWTRLYDPTD